MRVAIVGAGIAGVSAAHVLASEGHQVTVYERRGSVAAEASYAQLGLVAPSLAGPGLLSPFASIASRSWWRLPREAHVRPGWRLANWRWLWQTRQSMARRSELQPALRELAACGHREHARFVAMQRVEFEACRGHIVLLRYPAQLPGARQTFDALRAQGHAAQWLSAEECRAMEPGLEREARLSAAILFPSDEAANCRQIAHLMKEACERMGAEFRFATEVTRIETGRSPRVHSAAQAAATSFVSRHAPGGSSRSSAPVNHPDQDDFDVVMLCTGAQSTRLLSALGLSLPLMPVHGYTVTANLRHLERCPRAAITDADRGVSIVRFGQRVRIGGGLEIGTPVHDHHESMLRSLYAVLDRWFPGAAHKAHAQTWKGTCLQLPDGLPLIGESGATGVWLNLGHANQGWATACAAARLLADALAGRGTELPLTGFGLQRLRAT
ncbi:FAD-dependent oxidoreductase [Schlegelella sp. S2-27]|uniref:FAD-dependent oxidoreductase n=1 Tax=Caldimonas mangrovi TaxID=2944811 RepID=A0ABT0YQK8_9BURK|nr:FAD-dependent oxidoreductase [Caldimonas mangrovi]MCM5681022.1 FAD-dependent oxidoreductase [Caldimonas mangrovi]